MSNLRSFARLCMIVLGINLSLAVTAVGLLVSPILRRFR